eukprot:IDg13335t1
MFLSEAVDEDNRGIPLFNLTLMCLHESNEQGSLAKVKYTQVIGAEKTDPDFTEKLRKNGFDTPLVSMRHRKNDVGLRLYLAEFVKLLEVPLFSTATPVADKLRPKYLDNLNLKAGSGVPILVNGSSILMHVRLDGVDFTCSVMNPWCIRETGMSYEVIYPYSSTFAFSKIHFSLELLLNGTNPKSLVMSMPINISRSSFPRLATDPYMLRPQMDMWTVDSIEQNILLASIGYNFGFTTDFMVNGTVIVSEKSYIVPTVQLGYFVCILVMVFICVVLIVYNQVALSRRKIRGLVGEKNIILWWQQQHSVPTQQNMNMYLVRAGNEYTLRPA